MTEASASSLLASTGPSLASRRWRALLAEPKVMIGGGFILALIVIALFAPWIAPKNPLDQDLMLASLPPAGLASAEPGYYLGTDDLGRDVLSRLIYGARIALIVAFVAASLAALVGTTLGLLAGWYRGWVDGVISRLVDIWMAFPPVLLSILLVAVLGAGVGSVIAAIAIIDWTRFCRVVRAETMAQAQADYVTAAHAIGFPPFHILMREILAKHSPGLIGAGQSRNGHCGHRRGDPVVRRPVGVVRHADLGRHDRRGEAIHSSDLVGVRGAARRVVRDRARLQSAWRRIAARA